MHIVELFFSCLDFWLLILLTLIGRGVFSYVDPINQEHGKGVKPHDHRQDETVRSLQPAISTNEQPSKILPQVQEDQRGRGAREGSTEI